MPELPRVEVNERAARRLRDGHPWAFRSDLRQDGGAQPGEVVRVVVRHRAGGRNGLGLAFFNPRSQIVLRMLGREETPPGRDFWAARLEAALELRQRLGGGDSAGRLVFSEADGLPGLIVDRYADVLVLQTLSAGAERLKGLFVELLSARLAPRAVVERNDSTARRLEGLPEQTGLLAGALSGPVEILEGGLRVEVDPLAGQKTGHYLDQRENRVRAAAYARGRCLDVFSYQGGFGLQLKRGGAAEVTLVDQSERALQAGLADARRNGLEVLTRAANAFDFLRDAHAAGERYEVVVLDPPAFARNRQSLEGAARGYKEINLRAMKLLAPGGVLITSSCSYHMLEDRFEAMLTEAARDVGRGVQLLERRGPARDHPERLGFPEGRYLKCFVLRLP
ncbi:MAG TPA: class I SAM-dependent rRNA methyltransferase [Myxococcota bacterium]|nr:class I SAM-dependent rRNA methyltransferase [Myxococcota bacterium]HRY94774.1 class I SAM-dependent rRNA methyltransferase [Myxococcota bacterium]HSA21712.1 class I SAM-dependent rRNA methyltransferase [Myxococcota bacterium]